LEEKKELRETILERADDVERMAEQLQATMIRACNAAIPRKKWHNRSVPWWTPELTREKRRTYRARRRYQATKDPTTREQEKLQYRELMLRYKKAVTKAKTQSWQKFVTKEGNKEPRGIIYKTVAGKIRREETVSTLQTPQEEISNWRSTAEAMLAALLPDDQESTDTSEQATIRRNTETLPNVEDTAEFRMEELCEAVKRLTRGKCPGPDMIEVEVIQHAWGVLHQEILKTMNGCCHTLKETICLINK
jgi:hypothetical protein